MKLEVPFYKQTTSLNCGPTALKMVFSYFGKNSDIEEIERAVGIKEGKAISTIHLAIASASFGFKNKFFSKSLDIGPKTLELEFVKNSAPDNYVANHINLKKKAVEMGVDMQEKKLSVSEVLSYVTEKSVPIVLLDWNVIVPKFGTYHGHFVPVVGYEEENIYIHSQGLVDSQEFMPIRKEIFDKARKAKGTDEDILVISR